ncbi:MAG: methyltransferase domain-containing protein [Microcystis aeruginosa DA14]|uniref:Methyltransferase domain-containing protein n=1 Tax=Microcystis aeruginosa DA14 TaxID=1987506 RepID=A0A3E0MA11_MICAE|nr:MAG: methyltransferase domain-containing protein [Microcystis aeruginosa DA14]
MNRKINTFNQDTKNQSYSERLLNKQTAKWKEILDVQAPYRWNLQRLNLGFTLDIGCGIGRNLINLKGNGIGIDHNFHSVEVCRARGFMAFTPEEFQRSSFDEPEKFDSILLAHVAEHMRYLEVIRLLNDYVYLLKNHGKLVIITPQEAGFKSDATHVEFMNFAKLKAIARELDSKIIKQYSFPFPRIVGKLFKYNEFVSLSQKEK